MHRRSFAATAIAATAVATAAAAAPQSATATPDKAALRACETVFVAGLAPREIPAAGYRVTFVNRGYVETEAQYDAGTYTYDVLALDRNDVAFAAGKCVVDEQGALTALTYEPVSDATPALAAAR